MANGFLSPDGIFWETYHMGHFNTARKVLKAIGHIGSTDYPKVPTDILCIDYGFLYLREYHNGLSGGIHEEELDSVWMKHDMTDKQAEWLNNNDELLSGTQKRKLLQFVK